MASQRNRIGVDRIESLEARRMLASGPADAASALVRAAVKPAVDSHVAAKKPSSTPTATKPAAVSTRPTTTKAAQSPLVVGAAYVAPASPRTVINQNAGWRFALNPSGTPQSTSFNDSSFASVSLPHTFNNVDAVGTSYASGDAWYRKTINVDASLSGKRLMLDFEGAFTVTTLYIDGAQVDYKPASTGLDAHSGGFSDFLFDVTSKLTTGSHLIAVKVNTRPASNLDVPPSNSGDYSKQGGLYRDVQLIALPQTRIARTENVAHVGLSGTDVLSPISTPGFVFTHTPVQIGSTSTTLTIKTVYDNNSAANQSLNVTSYLVDANGVVQAQVTTAKPLSGSATGASLTQTATLNNPHLWNGRIDPYLYTLYVEVRDASTNALVDLQQKKVGIRSFTINANANNDPNVAPFLLNGQRYTLVGADVHQDSGRRDANGNPYGWAQPDSTIQADVDLLLNAGATVIRTSHYQENQAFYDYCDQVGMMVYTEISINGTINGNDAFTTNAQDQYQELIRQTQANPSVFAWGFGNETSSSAAGIALFTQLNDIAHAFDISRKTAFAQYGGSQSSSSNMESIPDIKGTHRYDYWYQGYQGPSGVQDVINAYPSQPVGITEVGAGGSAYQYADSFALPVSSNGGASTHYHAANRQVMINQLQMTEYEPLNNLWARIVWQAFDHGSSSKNEGDQSGLNDKGLTTRDRVLKDSYYYFSALWNDPTRGYANRKVLEVGNKLWTTRNQASTQITVYSNLGAPSLSLNGTSLGVMSPLTVRFVTNGPLTTVQDVYVMNVTLAVGSNTVSTSKAYGGQTYTNAAAFSYYDAATFAKGTLVASGVAINRTFNYDANYKTTSNPFNYALANGTYDVKITSPAGGANNISLEGQTAGIDSNGLASADTFYSRVTVTDGQLTVAGAPGAYAAAVSTIDITAVDAVAPTAVGVINGGAAQRSRIESLGVTFSEPVTLSSAAVSLGRRTVNGVGYAATFALTAGNPSSDGATYALSLTNGQSLTSLIDGNYDLIVDPAKVADLAGNLMASPYVLSFYRLFGDVDGDRGVSINDFNAFSRAFASSAGTPQFNSAFDFDNDGGISINDFNAFTSRFGFSI